MAVTSGQLESSAAKPAERPLPRRPLVWVFLAYTIVAAMAAVALFGGLEVTRTLGLMVLVPLFLISLVLVNAQAVTALTTERDGRTLDLLLVTDLTPREFIFGKLGGVLYNAKEMVLLPLLICLGLWWRGAVSTENTFYIVMGLLVMDVFVAESKECPSGARQPTSLHQWQPTQALHENTSIGPQSPQGISNAIA